MTPITTYVLLVTCPRSRSKFCIHADILSPPPTSNRTPGSHTLVWRRMHTARSRRTGILRSRRTRSGTCTNGRSLRCRRLERRGSGGVTSSCGSSTLRLRRSRPRFALRAFNSTKVFSVPDSPFTSCRISSELVKSTRPPSSWSLTAPSPSPSSGSSSPTSSFGERTSWLRRRSSERPSACVPRRSSSRPTSSCGLRFVTTYESSHFAD